MRESTVADMIFDPSMKYQALAVLAFLWGANPERAGAKWDNERKEYDLRTETHSWHNGREVGFVLSAMLGFCGDPIHFAVSENRNSDDIVVWVWKGGSMMNPPTLHDVPEGTYEKRRFFPYGKVVEVADFILGAINEHLEESRKNPPVWKSRNKA